MHHAGNPSIKHHNVRFHWLLRQFGRVEEIRGKSFGTLWRYLGWVGQGPAQSLKIEHITFRYEQAAHRDSSEGPDAGGGRFADGRDALHGSRTPLALRTLNLRHLALLAALDHGRSL